MSLLKLTTAIQSDITDFNFVSRMIKEVLDPYLDRFGLSYEHSPISPVEFGIFCKCIGTVITERQAKSQVFPYMVENYTTAVVAILSLGLLELHDQFDLDAIISALVNDNPEQVIQFKNGNQKIIGFFVGKIMKETKGSVEPKLINEKLLKVLTA